MFVSLKEECFSFLSHHCVALCPLSGLFLLRPGYFFGTRPGLGWLRIEVSAQLLTLFLSAPFRRFRFPFVQHLCFIFLPGTSRKRVTGQKMMEYKCCTIRKQKWRNGTDKESMRSYADMFVFLGQCCVLRVTKAKLGHEVGLSRKQRKRKRKHKKQFKPKVLRGFLSIILC